MVNGDIKVSFGTKRESETLPSVAINGLWFTDSLFKAYGLKVAVININVFLEYLFTGKL